jgi:NAD(P)H dehydrogenase (quinone)
MANALIIYAHPAASASFNFDMKERLAAALESRGHKAVVRDLYGIGFDPVLSQDDLAAMRNKSVPLDVRVEQEFILGAGTIAFIYPIWWAGPPAMMKGYFDRVLSSGFAYTFRNGLKVGLLNGRRAIVINSHGNPAREYDGEGYYAAMKKLVDDGALRYCGFDAVRHIFYGDIMKKSAEEKEADIASAIESVMEFME